jgi:hypothetical protein
MWSLNFFGSFKQWKKIFSIFFEDLLESSLECFKSNIRWMLFNDFFLTIQMSGSTNTSIKIGVLLVVYVLGNWRQTSQNTEYFHLAESTLWSEILWMKRQKHEEIWIANFNLELRNAFWI